MKLTLEEKNFLENIVAISALDRKTVKTLFRSLLIAVSMSVYADENEIIIPYLCKLKIDYNDYSTNKGTKVKVNIDAEPCIELIEEIKAISEGNHPPSKKYLKKEISEEIRNQLEISEMDLNFDI
jgi:hypothetical protein